MQAQVGPDALMPVRIMIVDDHEVVRNGIKALLAEEDGEVLNASSTYITIRYQSGREQRYPLLKFVRSNQGTCISQRPLVRRGDRVTRHQLFLPSPRHQRVTTRPRVFVEQVAVPEPAGRDLLRLLLGDQLAEQTVIAQLAQLVLSQEAQPRNG